MKNELLTQSMAKPIDISSVIQNKIMLVGLNDTETLQRYFVPPANNCWCKG